MTEAWRKALRFAALSGASRVHFQRQNLVEDGIPTVRYTLRSETQAGNVIGDDRDYDLLKVAMMPLEKLAEYYDHEELSVELDLQTDRLNIPENG